MFHGVIHKITLAQFFWDTVYIQRNHTAAVHSAKWCTTSINSRQRRAISGRPLPERTDFGPAVPARQTHVCPGQPHYGFHLAMFSLTIFSSEYYQVPIATHLPTPEG